MPESYESILIRMKQTYERYAGFLPERESDIMIRLQVLAGEIYQERVNAAYIMNQMFPTTASGEYLDRHAAERGLTRKQAAIATGSVHFFPSEEVHGEILIPAGTQVCTYTDNRRFVTDSDATLRSSDDRVSVAVTAVEPGAAYNARGGTVTVIVTPVAGIGSVYNGSLFRGGEDVESDDQLRERIIESYISISNSVNAAYYESIAMQVPGVYSASAVGCARGAGTVNVYVLGDGSRVSADVLAQVQSQLSMARELNVDVLAAHPQEVAIGLCIWLTPEPGYSYADISQQVETAVTEYVDRLGIGHSVLLNDIGEVIYHIKGVAKYRFDESYGSDSIITDRQYPSMDQLILREG